jgi:hypothetical protein
MKNLRISPDYYIVYTDLDTNIKVEVAPIWLWSTLKQTMLKVRATDPEATAVCNKVILNLSQMAHLDALSIRDDIKQIEEDADDIMWAVGIMPQAEKPCSGQLILLAISEFCKHKLLCF